MADSASRNKSDSPSRNKSARQEPDTDAPGAVDAPPYGEEDQSDVSEKERARILGVEETDSDLPRPVVKGGVVEHDRAKTLEEVREEDRQRREESAAAHPIRGEGE